MLLFPIAFCAACSAAGGEEGYAVSQVSRSYATQIRAPNPDYRRLLGERKAAEGWTRREATSPMPADAKAIGAEWIARLETRGALLGYGLAGKAPEGPVSLIDTGLTEREFESWTATNGWRVPGHISWSFVPPLTLPGVSEEAQGGIRIWPASTGRTGAQNQALFHGRVELRDGCFFVGQSGQPVDKLAWFHAELGIDVDEAGYFVLRDRVSGETLARLGEDMNWGGPASARIDEGARRALHEACGQGEIYIVGSPESSERFLTQYPHLRNPQPPPPPPPPPPRP